MKYFLKKSINKIGVYLQIYEAHCIPGKGARNKSYQAIGYVDELIKSGIKDPISHYRKYVAKLNEEQADIDVKQIGSVSVNKNVGYFLLKAMIDEDMKYAGYNLIVTSETNMSGRQFYEIYHNLWRIEESFRIMKSYLDARPAFLQKRDSIYGHFLVNYLALVVLRLIELKEFDDELPLNQIVSYIRDFRITETAEKSYINTTTNNTTYKFIKSKLGLSKLGNLYLKEKDVNNILNYEI